MSTGLRVCLLLTLQPLLHSTVSLMIPRLTLPTMVCQEPDPPAPATAAAQTHCVAAHFVCLPRWVGSQHNQPQSMVHVVCRRIHCDSQLAGETKPYFSDTTGSALIRFARILSLLLKCPMTLSLISSDRVVAKTYSQHKRSLHMTNIRRGTTMS